MHSNGLAVLGRSAAIGLVADRHEDFDRAGIPFAKAAWLRLFLEEIAGPEWRFAAIDSGAHRGALMLLHQTGRGSFQSIANYYTSLSAPYVGSDASVEACRALVSGLRLASPAISTLNLWPLDADAGETAAIASALREAGWYVRRYACHANWYLPSAGLRYAAYLASRPSQLRNTVERKGRKFPGEIRIVTEEHDVHAAMDAYEHIYRRSWKEPEPYPGFIRAWAVACARRGWLRLGVATLDEVPIAAQFWFTVDGRASIFKLAYDESHAKWSAGTLLTMRLMQRALDEDRVIEVDYLTGDDPYKATWMSHRRERIGLMACNLRSVRGLARAAYEAAGSLRSRLPRPAVPAAVDTAPSARR
jgi:hypothetical protein